jgi:hypothetical protein
MRLSRTARIALAALLPVVAVVELALAEVEKRRVPTDAEWRAAAEAARGAKRPGDAVIVAPHWAGPLGRKAIGEVDPAMINLKIVARSDLDVYPRVLELSDNGRDDPQTKGWKLLEERKFGHASLRVFENPKPQKLLRDLVDELGPETPASKIALVNGAPPVGAAPSEACRWETGASRIPNMAQGPGTPYARWLCPPFDPNWTYVGETVITDLDYMPRRCMFMHPTDLATAVTYPPRRIGTSVVAYVGLHVFTEREGNRSPLHVRIEVGGKEVAHARHKDGDGWLRFEGSTAEFAGQDQPVRVVTWAEGTPQFRVGCVAAQLRN